MGDVALQVSFHQFITVCLSVVSLGDGDGNGDGDGDGLG